jgi:hypothetical protein
VRILNRSCFLGKTVLNALCKDQNGSRIDLGDPVLLQQAEYPADDGRMMKERKKK